MAGPSADWLTAGKASLRRLAQGCAALSAAVGAAAAQGLAEPSLLQANHSCARLQDATIRRRRDRKRLAVAAEPAFREVRRVAAAPEAAEGERSAEFWEGVVARGEPVVVSGSGAFGLGLHDWASIAALCGERRLRRDEAAFAGELQGDSVTSVAIADADVGGGPLRLREGLVADGAAVAAAAERGRPVGVSGWVVDTCPPLAAQMDWPPLAHDRWNASTRRPHAEPAAGGVAERAEAGAEGEEGGGVWGWATRRVWACPPGSASALHTDLHGSHHLLALLSGGAKEYVVFPADAVTRERLRYGSLL